MATVIPSSRIEKHHVDKYNFKVIAFGSSVESADEAVEVNREKKITTVDSSALDTKSKESLIESLMKKTDEMSSNFIKLQMKFEAKEEEFKKELQEAKERAFAEGMEAGKAEAFKEIDETLNEKLKLFKDSISKLDAAAKEFELSLKNLKKELVVAAVDIAQEVIKIELSSRSWEVAKILARELIDDLQGASKITLKVNPKDHTAVTEEFGGLEHIVILADSAVSEGGVVVVSDVGNIDAQISKRFERVKRVALSE